MNTPRMTNTEGYVDVPGGRVRYRVEGAGDRVPLLLLHGGPGFTCDYLGSLAGLADERPVVFYDQLGCGGSDRPDDPALWTIERFMAELDCVRRALGLDRVHLLGQSWGCMLGVDYALTRPSGLLSLVLASPPLSIPLWVRDAERLRGLLPSDVQETLRSHEERGFTDCLEYKAATLAYERAFICRLDPFPEEFERSVAGEGQQVYHTMWGPNEFTVSGTLRDYDRMDRLGELTVPTLFTCGRHDEATPEATRAYQERVPGSRMVVFEDSSHVAHLEQREAYLSEVRAFLRAVED